MSDFLDTIAAVSTPDGMGGIGIIRVSGPEAAEIAGRVFEARDKKPLEAARGYTVRLGTVFAGDDAVDDALALVFRAPKSYTGEDVVELQCHGGPVLLQRILRALSDGGARPALPGEFTRRALVNGRISLTEAEGIANVISAVSSQGEAAAYALSRGSLSRETERLKEIILSAESAIAAYIDFPEEDVEPVDGDLLAKDLAEMRDSLQRLVKSYETGLVLLRGVPAVIAGSPNVGKSTLMNLIAGYEKAIVTPAAGTTRDILEHRVRLGGVTLALADTAGIREPGDDIERIGVRLALERIEQSALVFAVFDSSRALSDGDRELIERLSGKRAVAVVNKTDLAAELDFREIERAFEKVVYISANDPRSLEVLEEAVARMTGVGELSPDAPVLVNERQRAAAKKALDAVSDAIEAGENGMTLDVTSALLTEALEALMELSGENVSEAVLDEVFSRFCVGK